MTKTGKYVLNANKTKLYNLAKSYYPNIELMKKTVFIKAFRSHSFWLECYIDGVFHELFLSFGLGEAFLGDKWSSFDDFGESVEHWDCHLLCFDELQKFDLLKFL